MKRTVAFLTSQDSDPGDRKADITGTGNGTFSMHQGLPSRLTHILPRACYIATHKEGLIYF